ncbi:MAG TPA: NAD(P)H-hydrate dehydratase, partial [Coriobacteriia bacterium]|nr:NAD(P)H-hydrate dehydratase [Coriobacteriia bacterium]
GAGTLRALMERAGEAVAREVVTRAGAGKVAVVCGAGNNGGDGWVAARLLHEAGGQVRVLTPVAPDGVAGDAGDAARLAVASGVAFTVHSGAIDADGLCGHEVVIDALIGIGLTGPARPPLGSWIEAVNRAGAFVVSVDVPSGVDATSGSVDGSAVEADLTVTFSAPKIGCVLFPGARHAGEIVVADIGIPRSLLGGVGDPELWDDADYRALVPRPALDVHKGTRGRVLIVAGSGAFPGAAALAALGAQRAGAGYVTLAVPDSVVPVLQSKLSSVIVTGLPEEPSRTFASKVADAVREAASEFDAVVLGPGMTVADGASRVARSLAGSLGVPLVIDADGLNAFGTQAEALLERTYPTVITPHPGELARLLGTTAAEIQTDRISYGRALSGPHLACVLKGARTIVSCAGRQVITRSGNPALATAGTGDVLAGVAGALLAQGLGPLEAGALAAHLHGRAGDHASRALGVLSVVAEDIPSHLSSAIRELG